MAITADYSGARAPRSRARAAVARAPRARSQQRTIWGEPRRHDAIRRFKSLGSLVYRKHSAPVATNATWASQMSWVPALAHSSPTCLASRSNEAIAQSGSAFASSACEGRFLQTCARTVDGTTTSSPASAASFKAVHSARSFLSSAIKAPASKTKRLTCGSLGAYAYVPLRRARPSRFPHAWTPIRPRRGEDLQRATFASQRRLARMTSASSPRPFALHVRASRPSRWRIERRSYGDITAVRAARKRSQKSLSARARL